MSDHHAAARPLDRFGRVFELVIVRAIQILLMAITAMSTVILFVLLVQSLHGTVTHIGSVPELHHLLQRGFGGVLLVLLGLELLDTLKTYSTEHRIRAEVILIVALIAVGRHIIQLNFDETQGFPLLGLSALMLALAAGLFLVKRAEPAPFGPPADRQATGAQR